jgi:hypothetical protein
MGKAYDAIFRGYIPFPKFGKGEKALAEEWLRDMLKIGCRDIRCYTTEGIDATIADLAALDELLEDRRCLEFRVFGKCRDMHPDFLAAFLMVNAYKYLGTNYTLVDYGRAIKWDKKGFKLSAESLMKAWDKSI